MALRVCTRCKVSRDVTEFDRDGNRKDGLNVWCRACKELARKSPKKGGAAAAPPPAPEGIELTQAQRQAIWDGMVQHAIDGDHRSAMAVLQADARAREASGIVDPAQAAKDRARAGIRLLRECYRLDPARFTDAGLSLVERIIALGPVAAAEELGMVVEDDH